MRLILRFSDGKNEKLDKETASPMHMKTATKKIGEMKQWHSWAQRLLLIWAMSAIYCSSKLFLSSSAPVYWFIFIIFLCALMRFSLNVVRLNMGTVYRGQNLIQMHRAPSFQTLIEHVSKRSNQRLLCFFFMLPWRRITSTHAQHHTGNQRLNLIWTVRPKRASESQYHHP